MGSESMKFVSEPSGIKRTIRPETKKNERKIRSAKSLIARV